MPPLGLAELCGTVQECLIQTLPRCLGSSSCGQRLSRALQALELFFRAQCTPSSGMVGSSGGCLPSPVLPCRAPVLQDLQGCLPQAITARSNTVFDAHPSEYSCRSSGVSMAPASPGKWEAMIYSWALGFERSPADGILRQPDIYRGSPFPSLPWALWTTAVCWRW